MRRAAFGVTGADVDRVGGGVEAWIDDALSPGADPGVDATPQPTFAAIPAVAANATQAQRQARNQAVNAQGDQLTLWWVTRMLAAHRPVVERLTFAWHNHWATSLTKVREADLMLLQNQLLRRKRRTRRRRSSRPARLTLPP